MEKKHFYRHFKPQTSEISDLDMAKGNLRDWISSDSGTKQSLKDYVKQE